MSTKRYTSDPPSILRILGDDQPLHLPTIDRFVQAVNHHDTKTFLAFFPEGGVVIDSGRRFVGHDAVRGWSDREFIGAHGRMTVKKVEQTKNVVTVKADWKSNYYSGPSRFEFVLDGEQIQELRIEGE